MRSFFINISDEKVWRRLLEEDPELKELAIKAGVENNPQRAQELNYCYAINCGNGVVQSEAEKALARYLFCANFEENYKASIAGRILVTRATGISIDDL